METLLQIARDSKTSVSDVNECVEQQLKTSNNIKATMSKLLQKTKVSVALSNNNYEFAIKILDSFTQLSSINLDF